MIQVKFDIGKTDRKAFMESIEALRDGFEASYISLDFRFTNKKTKDYFCKGESILRLGLSARNDAHLAEFTQLLIDNFRKEICHD